MPIPLIRAREAAARITSSAEREAELAREIQAAQQEPAQQQRSFGDVLRGAQLNAGRAAGRATRRKWGR